MLVEDRLKFARELAREAGALAVAMRRAQGGLCVDRKGPQDFVTAADLAVETLIRERIKERYPSDAIIGEETGIQGNAAQDAVWIIDPVDGTTNYMRGMPDWAVSIAWANAGEIRLGVIYAPDHDILLEGLLTENSVALRNGDQIKLANNRIAAADALISVGWSARTDFSKHALLLARIVEAGGEYRRSGAATMGLIGVASAWVDGYIELSLNLWDAAAGIAILKAAGATVVAPAFTPTQIKPAPFLVLATAEHELTPLLHAATS